MPRARVDFGFPPRVGTRVARLLNQGQPRRTPLVQGERPHLMERSGDVGNKENED